MKGVKMAGQLEFSLTGDLQKSLCSFKTEEKGRGDHTDMNATPKTMEHDLIWGGEAVWRCMFSLHVHGFPPTDYMFDVRFIMALFH